MARNKFDVDEKLDSPFSLKHLKRSYTYIKQHKVKMLLSLLASILSVITALLAPKILQYAVDDTIPAKNYEQLIFLSILLACTIIFSILFSLLRSRLMTVVGQQIIYDIRKDLFEHLQRLSFSYYDNRPHGKILVRVVNYVNSVSDMLSNGIINFVLEIFNIAIIAIFMFTTDARLSLVVISGVPVFLVFVLLIKPKQRRSWQQVSNKSANLNAYLQESIDGTKIVQSFTREKENTRIFDTLNRASMKAHMRAQYISNLVWVCVDNISVIVITLMYIVGIAWITPPVSFGVFLAMSGFAWRFWQPILSLSNLYNSFINTIAYLERIFETMDEPIVVNDKEDSIHMPKIDGQVSFEDVTFSYDDTVNILEKMSMDVKAGESIALVGPTGAGKTTVINLISRFYNVNSGKILIDGQNIADVTLNSLRSQMGIMMQDSFIFSGTILDNIKYGKLDATDEEVKAACKVVCADKFIEEMKGGYNTEVKERGSRLSQGEKQLISFARTLLSDPKILILDEATSSIDAKTEKALQMGLLALLKGRTSFIIAHRLSTIKNCDRIMYISHKGITECGTHSELLKQKGEYYKLHISQAEDLASK